MRLKIFILVMCVCSVGCTVSAPQLERISRIFNIRDFNEPAAQVEPNIWIASANNQGAILRPYTSGTLIVFANEEGNAISFDGWVARSIVGFGFESPVKIAPTKDALKIETGRYDFTISCGAWIKHDHEWQRRCESGQSRVVLDSLGNITRIETDLGVDLGVVRLTLVPQRTD